MAKPCTAPCLPPCPWPAKKGKLCGGHYQRKLRKKPINTPLRSGKPGRPVLARLPEEHLAELALEAGQAGVSVPEVIRAAVEIWLALPPSRRRAALRRGSGRAVAALVGRA